MKSSYDFRGLKSARRGAIILHLSEGKNLTEIARHIGMSVQKVNDLLSEMRDEWDAKSNFELAFKMGQQSGRSPQS